MRARTATVLCWLLPSVAGCYTPGPGAVHPSPQSDPSANPLQSLDPPPAPPAPEAGDPYPATCSTFGTHDEDGGFDRVDATCYLHADLPVVWKTLLDPKVLEDPSTVDFQIEVLKDEDPAHVAHRLVTYDLKHIFTVSYTLEWIYAVVAKTGTAPTHAIATFAKTSGTSFISILAGSYELTSPAPGITELVMSNHVSAAQTGVADLERDVLRTYSQIVTAASVPAAP